MKHLPETLLNQANIQKQRALWGLLFEEIPDYDEIRSGTPKISPIFENLQCLSEPKNINAPRAGSAPFFQGVLEYFWYSFDGVRVELNWDKWDSRNGVILS